MNLFVSGLLGAGVGLGVMIALAGLAGRQLFGRPSLPPPNRRWGLPMVRIAAVAVIVLAVLATTGWLVGAVLAALAAWTLPSILGGKAAREKAIARTEAIASWTEMIRDSIVAASGLEEAISATANVAPAAVAPEVKALVRRLEHQRLPDALVAFGAELQHPSADLVVAALVLAARLEASDLSSLLTRLAESTRSEARMRVRVEVGRARVRTATKVIAGVVAASVAFLALVQRDYLAAYDTATGQLVLALVGGIFALGGWLLTRMAAVDMPERFTARAGGPGGAP